MPYISEIVRVAEHKYRITEVTYRYEIHRPCETPDCSGIAVQRYSKPVRFCDECKTSRPKLGQARRRQRERAVGA